MHWHCGMHTGAKREMEALEKRYLDGECTLFAEPECPRTHLDYDDPAPPLTVAGKRKRSNTGKCACMYN